MSTTPKAEIEALDLSEISYMTTNSTPEGKYWIEAHFHSIEAMHRAYPRALAATDGAEPVATLPEWWRPSHQIRNALKELRQHEEAFEAFDGDRRGIAAAIIGARSRLVSALQLNPEGDEDADRDYALVKACADLIVRMVERRPISTPPAPEVKAEARVVAVKPLIWDQSNAETPVGSYYIDDQEDLIDSELKGRPPFLLSVSRLGHSRYQSLDEAKASAQADYEARIRSALVEAPPAPSQEVSAAEMREAAAKAAFGIGVYYRRCPLAPEASARLNIPESIAASDAAFEVEKAIRALPAASPPTISAVEMREQAARLVEQLSSKTTTAIRALPLTSQEPSGS